MTEVALEVPDAQTARDAVDRWAAMDPQLATLLAAGLSKAHAVARWGLSLLKASRSLDAISALRVGVALSPEDPSSSTNLGIALDRAGSPEPATTCFERSVALAHAQPHTWLLLGLARTKRGDFGGAQAAYQVALDHDATSAVVWQCMGLLKEERRDYAGAVECFLACAKYSAPSAAISANLGKLQYQLGRIAPAHDAFSTAARLDPGNPHYAQMLAKTRFLVDVIAGQSVEEALGVFQDAAPREEKSEAPSADAWLEAAAGLLGSFGYIEAATQVARARAGRQPESASAKYLLAAVLGDAAVARSPAEYIVENFDAFAEGFDAKLVGVLEYDVPEKLVAAVRAIAGVGRLYDALDVGCGTGLCGPLLRPLARSLTGVDLSSKMLALAAKRGVYDTLQCEDIVLFLRGVENRFDLIVAADVLNYFGDLGALFPLVAKATRAGGLFAFSDELGAGEGYRLQPSGRFAHATAYVRAAAAPAFVEEAVIDTAIRLEANQRVPGQIFVWRRRE